MKLSLIFLIIPLSLALNKTYIVTSDTSSGVKGNGSLDNPYTNIKFAFEELQIN